MVRQSHVQTGSAREHGRRPGGATENSASSHRHTNAALGFSLLDEAAAAAVSSNDCVAVPIVSCISRSISSPLQSSHCRLSSPSTLLSRCRIHFSPPSFSLSLPPLCHSEKLQYGAGALSDTDASPIRCAFLFESVFGCVPPTTLPTPLSPPLQKKQKNIST